MTLFQLCYPLKDKTTVKNYNSVLTHTYRGVDGSQDSPNRIVRHREIGGGGRATDGGSRDPNSRGRGGLRDAESELCRGHGHFATVFDDAQSDGHLLSCR